MANKLIILFNDTNDISSHIDPSLGVFRQGDVGHEIYCHFENFANYNYGAYIMFERADGSKSPELPMTLADFSYSETLYSGFKLVIDDEWITAQDGSLKATVRVRNASGTVVASGLVPISLEKTVYDESPDITVEQYNAFVAMLEGFITDDSILYPHILSSLPEDLTDFLVNSVLFITNSDGSLTIFQVVASGEDKVLSDAFVIDSSLIKETFSPTNYTPTIYTPTTVTTRGHFVGIDNELGDIITGGQVVGRAVMDEAGNSIRESYGASLYTDNNDAALKIALRNKLNAVLTTLILREATPTKNGLMSSADKVKLEALPTNANLDIVLAGKVPTTRKILGIDLADDILLDEFKTALGEAIEGVSGLMSATDKARLDALHALLGSDDADAVVNTINEVLAIFNQYPEGVDLVNALAGKVDKVAGKGLSKNDFTDALKAKLDGFQPQIDSIETLLAKKNETYISAYSHVPDAISSTFNGWLIPFSKYICDITFKSIKVILSLSPLTMDVKCILMDANKSVLKDITKSCTNGQEEIFDLNWDIRDVLTDVYYIGFIGIGDGETHLMIHKSVNGTNNSDYVSVATPIENAYTTNKGASWSWMNNKTSMDYKKMWFIAQIEKLQQSQAKDDTATKEELNNYSTNYVLGKENHATVNLFNVKTISAEGHCCDYTNGRFESYPANPYIQNYVHSDYIEVEEDTDYAFTGGNSHDGWQENAGICFFDEDKIFISGVAGGQFNVAQKVYHTPVGTKSVVFNFSRKVLAQIDVQFEEGDTATPYQPYYGDLYYLNNLLIKGSQIEDEEAKTLIRCADSYDLVVGDTFELFYKGILEVFNYENYNILCKCDIGKCLTRKFVVDSITSAMVGNHTLQIIMYNNEMKQLDQKTITLNVHNVATSPSAEKVVLCIGDSLTRDGHWVDEFGRRLTKTTNKTSWNANAPTGLGLTNINFIGKKTSIGGARYEGYGGYTFGDYLSTASPQMYWLAVSSHDKTVDDQESVWEDTNGVQWQLETIEANRLKFKKYSGTGVIPASGTLTWVNGGTHTSDIVFTSSTIAGGNPFVYNGAIDFEAYCADMGVSTIDEVYILLGWNNATTTNPPNTTNCKAFIDLLRTFNPNIKVVLMGLQIPSLDGCGVNYGATGVYAQYMNLVNYVHNLDDAYKGVTEDYVSGVYSVNLSGQFDTEYNMDIISSTPNTRNPTVISIQNNGVHPAVVGYYQIADVAYRWYNGNN